MKTIIICLSILTLLYVPAIAAEKSNFQNDSALSLKSHMSKSKIAAISLSTIGGACIISSIPIYIKANSMTKGRGYVPIGSNINYLIGDCLLIGGLLFEGIAIPLYIRDVRNNKKRNCAMQLKINAVEFSYNF